MASVRARVDVRPPALGPARMPRSDYSFKDERLVEIGRENYHLLERLSAIASRPVAREGSVAAPPPPSARLSTQTINRKRQTDSIHKENMRLLAKLQTTKSTFKGAKPPPRMAAKPVRPAAAAPAAPLTERPAWVDITAAPPTSAAWAVRGSSAAGDVRR